MLKTFHKLFNKSRIPNINPEFFHHLAMNFSKKAEKSEWLLNKMKKEFYVEWEEKLVSKIWNLEFKNPVWLAAWFAKEPVWLKFWEAFWFWAITIWWITKYSQKWNAKKRIFRFKDWIVNWMWLPGPGLDEVVKMLEKRKAENNMPSIPLWANLCNSLITKPEEKIQEFKDEMLALYPYVDYFELNVSCPNQAWVCSLQSEVWNILKEITSYNEELSKKIKTGKKLLFVKISPLTQNPDSPEDWTEEWLKDLANIFNQYKWKWLDWIIATNTAKEHKYKNKTQIKTPNWWIITWWASGKQIQEISIKTVKKLREFLDKNIPIIWVGWIGYDEKWSEWQSWINMLNAWAIHLQILSSFVQNWTISVVRDFKKALLKR